MYHGSSKAGRKESRGVQIPTTERSFRTGPDKHETAADTIRKAENPKGKAAARGKAQTMIRSDWKKRAMCFFSIRSIPRDTGCLKRLGLVAPGCSKAPLAVSAMQRHCRISAAADEQHLTSSATTGAHVHSTCQNQPCLPSTVCFPFSSKMNL